MYKKWQKNKIPFIYILILLLILVVGLIIVEITKQKKTHPAYEQQVEAAKIMKKSIDEISKKRRNLNIDIQVDGNVSFKNLRQMKEKRANVFVAGSSSVFNEDYTITEGVEKMKDILEKV